MRCTACEVDQLLRIERNAHKSCLIVEVWTCGASGATTETDRIAGVDDGILLHELSGEVPVEGLKTIGVTDHHILTVATTINIYQSHATGEGGTDGISAIKVNVNTLVHATEATTIAVAAIDAADAVQRVDKFLETDLVARGNGCRSPAKGIEGVIP